MTFDIDDSRGPKDHHQEQNQHRHQAHENGGVATPVHIEHSKLMSIIGLGIDIGLWYLALAVGIDRGKAFWNCDEFLHGPCVNMHCKWNDATQRMGVLRTQRTFW